MSKQVEKRKKVKENVIIFFSIYLCLGKRPLILGGRIYLACPPSQTSIVVVVYHEICYVAM